MAADSSRTSTALRTLVLALALASAGGRDAQAGDAASAGGGQASPATASAASPSLEDLARLVEEQRQTLEAERQEIEAQRARLAEQERRLAELEGRLAEATAQAAAEAAQTVQERLSQVEKKVQRVPELAVENLQGEFPRSLRIPGTDAAYRLGGQVRMVFIQSLDAIGSDDRFITSSIPIEGSEAAGKTSRIQFSVVPSKINFDLRTPTGVGHMRLFLEGDFAGPGESLRLRHAFGQWDRWMFGQTWSTFSDPEAEPDGIDFEGLNAISIFRQPQVRWTAPLGRERTLALAIEEPKPDLTGAQGVNQIPDFVLRVRFDPERPDSPLGLFGEGSHIQTSILLRQLRGEIAGNPTDAMVTEGYGVNISGVVPAPWSRELDRFRFAWNAGKGIGRYITDLSTLGGQDAVFDPERGELVALKVASAYLGYEHWWNRDVRSTLTAGYVWVDNLDFQAPDSLHRTERWSANIAWSPIPRLDLVAEFLIGRRINADHQDGKAKQVQLGGTFRF